MPAREQQEEAASRAADDGEGKEEDRATEEIWRMRKRLTGEARTVRHCCCCCWPMPATHLAEDGVNVRRNKDEGEKERTCEAVRKGGEPEGEVEVEVEEEEEEESKEKEGNREGEEGEVHSSATTSQRPPISARHPTTISFFFCP